VDHYYRRIYIIPPHVASAVQHALDDPGQNGLLHVSFIKGDHPEANAILGDISRDKIRSTEIPAVIPVTHPPSIESRRRLPLFRHDSDTFGHVGCFQGHPFFHAAE
jgi:hypothetical protein